VLVVVTDPDESAITCCSAYAMEPGCEHLPACKCDTWLELGGSPVNRTVTVKVPSPFTIVPVPEAPLPFCAVIVKLIPGLGDGVLAVPPPQPARARTPARTTRECTRNSRTGLITLLSYALARCASPCAGMAAGPCKGRAVQAADQSSIRPLRAAAMTAWSLEWTCNFSITWRTCHSTV
jgi:hypothetical protein